MKAIKKITERDLMEVRRNMRLQKGMSAESVSQKEKIVGAINLLLCHCTQESMIDTVVGLKIVMERLGIEDSCHIMIDADSGYKARLYYEDQEEE